MPAGCAWTLDPLVCSKPRVRIAAGFVIVAAYAALVIWLTWPLASVATTDFPITLVTSRDDTMLTTWAAAHETRALWSGAVALADAGIYHPTPNSLYYGETGFGVLPIFAPVFLATENPTLAMNVVFLAGVVLTASAIHAVTRWWTDSHAAGFVAGVSFVTTPWVLWTWVSTAPPYAMLQYLPLVIAMTAAVAARWRRTVGLGFLVALQGLTGAYNISSRRSPSRARCSCCRTGATWRFGARIQVWNGNRSMPGCI
jgi:hypothetical protein